MMQIVLHKEKLVFRYSENLDETYTRWFIINNKENPNVVLVCKDTR